MSQLTVLFTALFISAFAYSETLYISTLKAKLLKEPNAQSQILEEINRGETIEVKKAEGSWLQASYKNKTGWVSKLFTTKTPPLKNSDVNNTKQLDSDKVSRVRVNYENKGAARGLTDSGPKISRSGFEDNQKVYEGVKQIEKQEIKKEDLQKFQKEGKLKP